MPRSSAVRRLLAATVAGLCAAAVLPAAAGTSRAGTSDVVARATSTSASIGNGRIRRTWKVLNGGLVTSGLVDAETGRSWSTTASPDFRMTVDGIATTSTDGWVLRGITVQKPPVDPARPSAGGAALLFRYLRDVAGSSAVPLIGLELDRLVVLRPGSAMLEISSTLTSDAAGLARVSSYSLDEVTTVPIKATEVQAYHGGSDWRDDYRVAKAVTGGFDEEGEVARLDDGTGAGIFFVTERRSQVASRVGRDAQGRSWAGVDLPRDAFDWGPLRSDPPDYNRQDNPLYPVPVRARLVTPGQTMRLGRVFTGVYSGGAQEAGYRFASSFAANVMPPFFRGIGLNTFHPWSHSPQLEDRNLRNQALLAKKLGVETFMIDDQWQGGSGGESGDWKFDPVRFPDKDKNGIPDFVTFLHQQKLKLGLWMSLVEFNSTSQTYQQHPDWACAPTGDVTAQIQDDAGLGVWDVNNPAFRAYITGVVDHLVDVIGVTELKFDFQTWLDCGTHDYLDYEDGFMSLVRSFQAKHPKVTIELDETNDQRAWPFESVALGPSWFDNGHLHGSTATAKELHDLWVAAPWLPTSSIGWGFLDGTLDASHGAGYLAPMAVL
ncbi:MAG: Alpha-galactosidase, partial [Frankiales bacterium]|nr:Alpha-galactosidase [Frankiales bacterium]